MQKTFNTLLVLALLGMAASSEAQERENELFNFGWRFHLGEVIGGEAPTLDDADWKSLDLPYDYQLNQPWVETASRARGFKEQASGWFRKTFDAPEVWRGKQVLIDFEGLMYYGDVWFNGVKVGSTEYGYCGFECDLTRLLNYGGSNTLAVYTNTGVDGGSRWYTGGGINRDVHIIIKDEVSPARHGLYVTAQPKEAGNLNRWEVKVQAEFRGETLAKGALSVEARILDVNGQEVARSLRTQCPASSRLQLIEVPIDAIEVENPQLWSIEHPNLYTVELLTYCNDRQTDVMRTRFGFRTIEYGKDFGFRLNGEKVFLQGIANHVDFGGVGVAAFRTAIERQLRQLKAFGFNAVRCSHNPYPPVFYELCDEMGVLVVDEFVDKWSNDGNCWGGRESFMNIWPELLTEWVKRDRNHPCIILWSLGNEMQHRENASGYMTGDWGVTTFRILDIMLKRYDNTRPSTAAMYPARANGIRRADPGFREVENIIPPELSCITQVASYNYEYADYRRYKAYNPELIIFQSEASVNDLVTPYLRMDKASTVGLCYWGAIEYWGESDGWPKKGWNYSFFDHTLRPYPRAWLLRTCYVDEPQVHIGVLDGEQKSIIWNDILSGRAEMSHFYWKPNRGDSITLEVSTNCDEVELFQNGKSLGTRQNNRSDDKAQNKLLWRNIEWQPGKVEAIARNNGQVVARHELQSPSKASRLMVTTETPASEKATQWQADGMSLQYLRLQVIDSKGREVSNYEGELTIEVDGEATLLALDNGDHFTNGRLDLPTTSLYRGGALVILRSTSNAGKVQLRATAEGLKPVVINMRTK